MIGVLLFVGATGKSAQIPLYVWLPDAMVGPTPVSALIHAATMVTSGVYMIARLHFLYEIAPDAMELVAVIGAVTCFFAATIAITQPDIKRVLAYSTLSQLGYMFLAVGVGAFSAGIFHLMTHAFFKALPFLGAGSVIHGMSGEQDMNKMGGLAKKMPITCTTMWIATLAITAIPPFAGFFSKDLILADAYTSGHFVVDALGLITAGLTGLYMFRLMFMTFHGVSRVAGHPADQPDQTQRHWRLHFALGIPGTCATRIRGRAARWISTTRCPSCFMDCNPDDAGAAANFSRCISSFMYIKRKRYAACYRQPPTNSPGYAGSRITATCLP
jgi:NADH-quinone oxidoreductase subunit L